MLKSKFIRGVLVALCVLALSGCDTLNSIRMMQINSDVEPNWTGPDTLVLDAVYLGEKPYVYADVDGQRLLFLLDTGARFLILMDSPKVKQLSLNRGFDLALGGWGEEEDTKAFQTDIASIDLGGVSFKGMKAAVIPVSKSRYYKREDEAVYDGVIGHDMMKHFTWEFDASNNAIYLSKSAYIPEENAQRLEMDNFFNKIRVKGELAFNQTDTVEGDFIIDTGSRHYVKLSAAYPEGNDIAIDSTRVRAADFGLSGKVEHDRVVVPWLKLGDIKLDRVKVNLIPSDDEDDWWILGNALLNQFKTVIDYQSEAFYLVPQKDYVTDFNLLGLELRKLRSGDFVVRHVFPALPASELDVKVGDVVTAIDGMNADTLSLSAYNDLASIVGPHHFCIERQDLCFDIDTKDIPGYSIAR